MMDVSFLSLKEVTALHGAEINETVSRVVNSGWYLQGNAPMALMPSFGYFVHILRWVQCSQVMR